MAHDAGIAVACKIIIIMCLSRSDQFWGWRNLLQFVIPVEHLSHVSNSCTGNTPHLLPFPVESMMMIICTPIKVHMY